MGQQFVFVGPAHQVVAQHLVRVLGRLATGPEVDQQASDDRAVRLKVPDSNEFHVRVKKPGSQGASKFSVFF